MNKAVVLLLVVLASAVIATIYQKDDRKQEVL
jgi:cytochrome c biogenesis protein ResB